MAETSIKESFLELSQDARDLYVDATVPVLDGQPTPLEFYRDWVSANKPVIIRKAAQNWPALEKWNNAYLREIIGDTVVSVAVTPNGYADAVYEGKFVMPEERRMTFGSFLDIIEGKHHGGVFYVQKQDSNLTKEFTNLLNDVNTDFSWASEAFGHKPDAVNFWMGESAAITSMHKDHYENLYTVIRGQKTFTLLPPTDRPFIPYEMFGAAKYNEKAEGVFEVIDDHETGMVPWIPIDPLQPDLAKYPSFANVRPITVTVKEGETLYLPSLWFHHVQQTHGCIAVNHWYDMEYDIRYNYFHFVETLCSKSDKSYASNTEKS